MEEEEIRLSPTAIITYLRDPREFYYKYIMRLPTPVTSPMLKGNIVHKVLLWFFKKHYKANMEESMDEMLTKAWEKSLKEWKELKKEGEALEKERKDCKNILDMYLKTFQQKMEYLKQSEKAENDRHAFYLLRPKFREMWIEDKKLNVCGYIDRVHKDFDGNIIIGDYKTSNRYGIGTKTDYIIQCGIYALLYKRRFNIIPDYVSIIYLRFGEEVMVMVTPEIIKFALEKIEYVREHIKSRDINDYPHNPANKFYPFFDIDSGLEKVAGKERRQQALAEIAKKLKKRGKNEVAIIKKD